VRLFVRFAVHVVSTEISRFETVEELHLGLSLLFFPALYDLLPRVRPDFQVRLDALIQKELLVLLNDAPGHGQAETIQVCVNCIREVIFFLVWFFWRIEDSCILFKSEPSL
jgi:hypothetical protein